MVDLAANLGDMVSEALEADFLADATAPRARVIDKTGRYRRDAAAARGASPGRFAASGRR